MMSTIVEIPQLRSREFPTCHERQARFGRRQPAGFPRTGKAVMSALNCSSASRT
jgi:hypothetical protein